MRLRSDRRRYSRCSGTNRPPLSIHGMSATVTIWAFSPPLPDGRARVGFFFGWYRCTRAREVGMVTIYRYLCIVTSSSGFTREARRSSQSASKKSSSRCARMPVSSAISRRAASSGVSPGCPLPPASAKRLFLSGLLINTHATLSPSLHWMSVRATTGVSGCASRGTCSLLV